MDDWQLKAVTVVRLERLRFNTFVGIVSVVYSVELATEPSRSYGSKINKAYSILGIIKRNCIHMDESSFILLHKSMVRPHLEYVNSVWCPYKQGGIKELEKIQ